ncbi:MAG: 2-C-methyl-D-erythritol 4-phosphate cytidylyltransferase [Mediterranea sp.]|jgi:2-C-methyl-D-erythritol 4-phosphate cytidylyltransferase|nr:2-C-methyl-D-erythritol 4-phosphate cytidylyltransferase [Mediterranea sp.]
MNKYVLIVAGGSGTRMGGEIPKQFLFLDDGKPILKRTLETFHAYDPQMRIILLLPQGQEACWKQLCTEHDIQVHHEIAHGGETRFHSVRNGLDLIPHGGIVGIHDGVRPFVSIAVIARCYETAKTHKTAVPVVEVAETVRHLTTTGSETVNRNDYRLVQTPQVFDVALLKAAYAQHYSPSFTDDASVVEAMGDIPITLVKGNRENIKITTPFDLKIASGLIRCSI